MVNRDGSVETVRLMVYSILSPTRSKSTLNLWQAEEAYLNALYKVKKVASSTDADRPYFHHEAQLTFQTAVQLYESSVDSVIESRQRLRDTIKLEIDVLTKQKETEEQNRKTHKSKLYDANTNYTTFKNRDIVKLQKSYNHRCEELKTAQTHWQQQQQQQQQQQHSESTGESYRSNRNSAEWNASASHRTSGDYNRGEDHEQQPAQQPPSSKSRGMAGLLSHMRTRAVVANAYLTTPSSSADQQNKQFSKFAKMKKDITDADNEYRDGILLLENLRKKQYKTSEEVNRQLKATIKRKTETVKTSLVNILRSELDSLQMEINSARGTLNAASAVDSTRDLQVFSSHYQSQGYMYPTPVRYENYYFEGKCKEVLFGGSLETYAIEHNTTVPLLVIKCIEAIEKGGGLQKEGIYRVSGRQSSIEQLKHYFELDEDRVVLDQYDVFTMATILKMYLRELKRPLFDFNTQTRLAYSKGMSQAQRFGLLETKLSNLSLAHRSTLHYLIRHLAKINAQSQINKMNIPNLALIFTPVIFHDFNQTGTEDSSAASGATATMTAETNAWSPDELFEDLILSMDVIFPKAEALARRNNEHKLNQALEGLSPFSQHSQSNLLYLSHHATLFPPLPSTRMSAAPPMLLTQPMNPPASLRNSHSDSSATTRGSRPMAPPFDSNAAAAATAKQHEPFLSSMVGSLVLQPPVNAQHRPPQSTARIPLTLYPSDVSTTPTPAQYGQTTPLNSSSSSHTRMPRFPPGTTAIAPTTSQANTATPTEPTHASTPMEQQQQQQQQQAATLMQTNNNNNNSSSSNNSSHRSVTPPRQDSLRKLDVRMPPTASVDPLVVSSSGSSSSHGHRHALPEQASSTTEDILTQTATIAEHYKPSLSEELTLAVD
ncbi:hypothetical protein BDF20DRAFT_839935 [Mycotypha africana]|uniref:uncharacterized protein n=1 Tax=Mycotypha africana TaxID=64632 RepID=UPI002300CD67|nr:uncharacterized protein BDF20DRAFT_839935 [Mycotypha africana]KAI8967725.1 hypothetical protein BDF20DRAFT_839935 [Mycotypha africana]